MIYEYLQVENVIEKRYFIDTKLGKFANYANKYITESV